MEWYLGWRNQMIKIILIIEIILGILMTIAFTQILRNNDKTEKTYKISVKNDSILQSREKVFERLKGNDKKAQDTLNEILKLLRESHGTAR